MNPGKKFEKIIENNWETPMISQFPVTIKAKKWKVDLGCAKYKTLIECKDYKWTKSNNYPSGKDAEIYKVLLRFQNLDEKYANYRKIILFARNVNEKNVSFAEEFVRRNAYIISKDVEIWQYDKQTDKKLRII